MTRQLTNYQKEFIINYFFKDEKYAGWRNIATTLLEDGECVVAGEKCIWIGGIGNFIKTEKSQKFIDCLLYKFDLIEFLSSQWLRETVNNYIPIIEKEKEELKTKLSEVYQKCDEITNL